MSSKRFDILERIDSLLSAITTANGFSIEVENVSHQQLNINEMYSEQTPYLATSIGSGGANTAITTGSNIDSIVNIIIAAYIVTQPGLDAVEELDKLLESVQLAILNGTPNAPWDDKYKTASLNGLTYVYDVSFNENYNTDEGILSLNNKAYATWGVQVKYIASTINP